MGTVQEYPSIGHHRRGSRPFVKAEIVPVVRWNSGHPLRLPAVGIHHFANFVVPNTVIEIQLPFTNDRSGESGPHVAAPKDFSRRGKIDVVGHSVPVRTQMLRPVGPL